MANLNGSMFDTNREKQRSNRGQTQDMTFPVRSKCLPAKGPDRHSTVATKGQIPSFAEGVHSSPLVQNDDKVGRLRANQSGVDKNWIKAKQETRTDSKTNLEVVLKEMKKQE